MDQDAFETKYKGTEGVLPLTALKILLEDYAQLKGKSQMYAGAEKTAETLREFGLDAWDSFDDMTVDDATEAGMRRLDARGFMRAIEVLRSTDFDDDGVPGDDCADSGATSVEGASLGADDSDASYVPSVGSQDVLRSRDLGGIPEEKDEEVHFGRNADDLDSAGNNNVSGFTEVSGGLTTESEQEEELAGGTDSQDAAAASEEHLEECRKESIMH